MYINFLVVIGDRKDRLKNAQCFAFIFIFRPIPTESYKLLTKLLVKFWDFWDFEAWDLLLELGLRSKLFYFKQIVSMILWEIRWEGWHNRFSVSSDFHPPRNANTAGFEPKTLKAQAYVLNYSVAKDELFQLVSCAGAIFQKLGHEWHSTDKHNLRI